MRYAYVGPEALLALVLSVVAASAGHSQTSWREPNATDVAVSLRTKGHPGAALAVLTQALGPKSPQQMDDIADTLVAIATRLPGNDSLSFEIRTQALLTLIGAGQGDNGIVGVDHAVPYAGAAPRLRRVAEIAQDGGLRAGALGALMALPNRAAHLPFLEQLATSQNEVAHFAVSLLGNDTGPQGRAIAQRLFREGRVSEELAKRILGDLASYYGWR